MFFVDIKIIAKRYGKRPDFIRIGSLIILLRKFLSRMFLVTRFPVFQSAYIHNLIEEFREENSAFEVPQIAILASQVLSRRSRVNRIDVNTFEGSGLERLISVLIRLALDFNRETVIVLSEKVYGSFEHHSLVRACVKNYLLPHVKFVREPSEFITVDSPRVLIDGSKIGMVSQ